MAGRQRRGIRADFAVLALLFELKDKEMLPVEEAMLHRYFERFLKVLQRRWIDLDGVFEFTAEDSGPYSSRLKTLVQEWIGRDVLTYTGDGVDVTQIDEEKWRTDAPELGDYAVRLAAGDAIEYIRLHHNTQSK